MNKFKFQTKLLLFSAFLFVLASCGDDHFSRYEDPPWLGGSIIETLEAEGNYTILLDLMRKAGYEEPIEKGLFTIFAANDSSYQAYFNSKGIVSVDDVSEKQAFQLFTLNVLNTPRARQQLVFEYSQWHGGWQKPRSELGALLFRIPTRSKSNNYFDYVKYFRTFKGQTLKIAGQEKMVPLFSSEFFSDFNGASDGSDYTYFYPDTKWTGLQWYNASIDSIGKCSNGYLYFLDRAVPEIPSIEDYLRENQDRFGVYYDLIQRFVNYSFSAYDDDPERTRLYTKSYNRISNIASEIGPTSDGFYRRKVTFSLFLPPDEVLQQYLDNTFLKYFESLDSVPEISLVFLAQSCINNSLDIVSKIQRTFVNFYGDAIPIDIYNDVDKAVFLSNGPVYEMKKYYPPRAFTSTVGPVFFDKAYSTYLYGIDKAKMTLSLTSADLDVIIFAPPTEGLLEGGIRYYKPREQLEALAEDGTWNLMNEVDAKSFVSDHICTNIQKDFSGEGFLKMNSENYIHYKNNEIQAGGNQESGIVAKIIGSQKGDNGILYHLDNAIQAPKKDPARFMATNVELSEFFNLLYVAGIADTIIDPLTEIKYPRIIFLQEFDYWTVFAPTNDAIIQARNNGDIPEDTDELKLFIRYHFIPDKVIFDDGELMGTFSSARIDSSTSLINYYAPIEVINTKNNLRIVDRVGNTINVSHNTANNLVKSGVLHKINKVLSGK